MEHAQLSKIRLLFYALVGTVLLKKKTLCVVILSLDPLDRSRSSQKVIILISEHKLLL